MTSRGAKSGLALKAWEEKHIALSPVCVLKNAAQSYMLNEREALQDLSTADYKWELKEICP